MNDWIDLTQHVLLNIKDVHGRLRTVDATAQDAAHVENLYGHLERQRIEVERIRGEYEVGNLRKYLDENEVPIFQDLVARLSQQSPQISTKEPTAAAQDLTKYVAMFLNVGPHGPGGGEPFEQPEWENREAAETYDDEEDFGPDTHGSGGGEP